MNKPPGFTLIQCSITMAITILLCTLAIPNYFTMRQKHYAEDALKTIQQGLQYARTKAIFLNQKIIVIPIAKYNSWEKGFIIRTNEETLKTYKISHVKKINWYGFGSQSQEIHILPNGMTNNNGHFLLQTNGHSQNTYLLCINKALKIYIKPITKLEPYTCE